MDKTDNDLFTLRNILLLIGAFIFAAILLTALVIVIFLRGIIIEDECKEKADNKDAFLRCEEEAKIFYIF